MSNSNRKKFTKEFKIKAVQMVTEQGYMVSEAARRLGVDRSNLRRWKLQMDQNGDQAFPGNSGMNSDKEELHRLRREVKRLKMECDMIKRASAFFAKLPK